MWDELVRRRGGAPAGSVADAAGADLEHTPFLAVLSDDDGILPAVAALTPAQAVAYLLLNGIDSDPERANNVLEALRAGGVASYLLKSGRVGGAEPERSIEIDKEQAGAILDAIVEGSIEWEPDPDFGYRTATDVPGIEGRDRFLLVPRFLYARTERVYEYAALVPILKRERVELLSALPGLDSAIVDAVR
jgi:phosphoenolpyruvate carboxykinase (ATP)